MELNRNLVFRNIIFAFEINLTVYSPKLEFSNRHIFAPNVVDL